MPHSVSAQHLGHGRADASGAATRIIAHLAGRSQDAGGPLRLEGAMNKLYKRIKVNCEVETATNRIKQALDYLSEKGILLVPDGEDSLFHTADFRIMLPGPKDVGAVSVRKSKSWELCEVDFYQFFDDAENTICAVYTVLRNVLDYYVLDTQDTSAAPDAPTTYAERSEKMPMKMTLTVAQPSQLAFSGDITGWSFPFNMVDSSLVGTPEEQSRTYPHYVQVSATLELVLRWGFYLATFDGMDEQSKNDLMKVLFEHGKRYVIKKLRDTGELATIEKLDLNTSTPEARDRFDPSRIKDPVGVTLVVDVGAQQPAPRPTSGVTIIAQSVNIGGDVAVGDITKEPPSRQPATSVASDVPTSPTSDAADTAQPATSAAPVKEQDETGFADKSSRVKLLDSVSDAFEITPMKDAARGPMGDPLTIIKTRLLDFEIIGGVTQNQREVIGAALDRYKSYAIGKRDAIGLVDIMDLHSRLYALPTIGAKAEIGQPPHAESVLVPSPAHSHRPPPQVFLSYAREDIEAARRLFNDLHEVGVQVWFDKESLLPGQNWKTTIKQAIRDSRFFLALLSAKSLNKRGYVQKELNEALEILDEYPPSQIFIIPARLDDCSPTDDQLRDLNWADMFPDWEKGLARIMKAIGLQK